MFEFRRENRSRKILVLFFAVSVIIVAIGQSDLLMISMWPWLLFALLVYVAEIEDVYLFAREKSMPYGEAFVVKWQEGYKVHDFSFGAKFGIVATIAFMPILGVLGIVIVGGGLHLFLTVLFNVLGVAGALLPPGRF